MATALGNLPHSHRTHSLKSRAEVRSSRTDGEHEKRAGGEGAVYKTHSGEKRWGREGMVDGLFEGRKGHDERKPRRLWLSRKYLKDK